jgi:heme/copper-type cytochrome/quinol oxidase subunit 2
MPVVVEVKTPEDYAVWLKEKQAAAAPAPAPAAAANVPGTPIVDGAIASVAKAE